MVGISGRNPGFFREVLEFKKLNRSSDGAGGFSATPTTVFKTYGSIKPAKSVRALEDAKLILLQPYEVVIRYNKNKIPELDQLIYWRDKKFHIKQIQDDDIYKRYITLLVISDV